MAKIEPLSIIAALLALSTFLIGGLIGNLLLIISAILMALSYKRFKKSKEYTIKWPLYIAMVIVWGTIAIRIIGISLI